MKIPSAGKKKKLGLKLFRNEIEFERLTPTEFDFCLLALRFDARIMELFISYIAKNWNCLNPLEILNRLQESKEQAVLAVVLEHVQLIQNKDPKIYKKWKNLILVKTAPAPGEQFFIGIYPFAGNRVRENAFHPHPFYQKWGFYERDLCLGLKHLQTAGRNRRYISKKYQNRFGS
jgi:hypothetical protein